MQRQLAKRSVTLAGKKRKVRAHFAVSPFNTANLNVRPSVDVLQAHVALLQPLISNSKAGLGSELCELG
jgi:hypothetical protein